MLGNATYLTLKPGFQQPPQHISVGETLPVSWVLIYRWRGGNQSNMQKFPDFVLSACPRCQLRPSSSSPWTSSPSLCHRRCQPPWQLALCTPSDASNALAFSASAHRGSISAVKSIWSALTRWVLVVVTVFTLQVVSTNLTCTYHWRRNISIKDSIVCRPARRYTQSYEQKMYLSHFTFCVKRIYKNSLFAQMD